MHIPDNYLSVSTCAVMAFATAPVWARAIKRAARDFPRERFSALGAASAFSFLAMMFNVPLPGGATGHAVGGVALALLLGPDAACLALTIALAIQAFLFGDGGILALGANSFNMAFILPFSGYYSFFLLRRLFRALRFSARGSNLAALAIASYIGINLAALATAVELGVQPYLFVDANGQALYCPYPLSITAPAMAIGHLTVFGLAEVIFSVAVCSFIMKTAPDFAANSPLLTSTSESGTAVEKEERSFGSVYLALALLIVAAPLGLLATGTAWGEWGVDEIAEQVVDGRALGYTPSGMTSGFQWAAPFADYAASGLPDWGAYILAAIAGTAASIVLFKLASLLKRDEAAP